jgi:hypothetical protein
MALLSRLIGGCKPFGIDIPRALKIPAYAAPFGIITYVLYSPAIPITPALYMPYVALAMATAMIGKATGHGAGISLFEPHKIGAEREWVEWPIFWLMPILPARVYKAIVLALCEAIVWAGISYAVSPWLMLGLLCRPVAYYIGWSWWGYAEKRGHIRRTQVDDISEKFISYMPNFIGQPTQIGEFLTGAFAGAVLALLLFNA